MKNVDVSVVMAVKNEEKFISEALDSIIGQLGLSTEIIIIDDSSSDNTFNICNAYASNYENIILEKNISRGKVSAFNMGVDLSKGKFICLFAGDDIMPFNSLNTRYLSVKNIDSSIPIVGLSKLTVLSEDKKFNGQIIPKKENIGATSGVSPLMNRNAIKNIFPIPEILPNEDTWMKLCVEEFTFFKIIHSNTICCKWRMHSNNSINISEPFDIYSKKTSERQNAYNLFYKKYKDTKYINNKTKTKIKSLIKVENLRKENKFIRILFTRGPLVDRLRAISCSNKNIFYIRKIFFRLLSGW